MERHAVPQAGYPIRMISVIGLRRHVSWEWLRFPFALMDSLRETRRLFRAFRPHLVIGTGGYVSGPVGFMAGWFGVPLVIQEQNSYPGITTRLLAWVADQVHLTFPESRRFFLRKRNLQVSGNPTRSEIDSVGRTEARERLKLVPDKPTLCVIGGSQGAHSINVALSEALDRLTASGIQVVWQTGERDYQWASQVAARYGDPVRVQGFADMPTALGAADLILCRAGAMTLAEITRCGLPAVLVPYPYATANHQEHNARSLVEAGAAELILDRELNGDLLTEKVSALFGDAERLDRMGRASRSLGRPMAAQNIVDCGLRIADRGRQGFQSEIRNPKSEIGHIHFIGIGGIGMSGIAHVLMEQGYAVSGSDLRRSEETARLERMGARIGYGHRVEHIGDADLVVHSSAVKSSNPEWMEAVRRGIPIRRRAEVLGDLTRMGTSIGVAGTHGKTTTTAMIGWILTEAGMDPTILVGGNVLGMESNARMGRGGPIVVEADEFDRSFLALFPTVAVITTLEAEHLDCYKDITDLKAAFVEYANRVPFYGAVVACLDEENIRDILPDLPLPNLPQVSNLREVECPPRIERPVITYGNHPDADLRAADMRFEDGASSFEVIREGASLGTVRLKNPGLHNVKNALAAIAVGLQLGVSFEEIRKALSTFAGVHRRFEIKGEVDGITVVDDYAHHPTEVTATLEAAREGNYARILVAFQPHLFSRTRDFSEDFGRAFSQADVLVVTDVYPAREAPLPGVTGALVAEAAERYGTPEVHYVADRNKVARTLADLASTGDLMIVMGAGDIEQVGGELVALLRKKR
jgi:UDP-N-acetylmuramate--alanine ligase